MEAVFDAKGLFDAVSSREIGKITDKGVLVYLLSYREMVRRRKLRRLHHVPTESMLADDLTKTMSWPTLQWPLLYETGAWIPFARDDLEEDYTTMEPNGEIVRYRLVGRSHQLCY